MPTADPARELVRGFVNTVDVDEGTDALADASGYSRWAVANGLAGDGLDAELALARDLRSALRRMLAAHHERRPDTAALADLNRVADRLPLRLHARDDGTVEVLPMQDSPAGAVLAAVRELSATGDLGRLKLCPADDCQWAFYDKSRNRSRRWCAMEVCGNRQKTREYRRRHGRSTTPQPG